MNALDLFFSPSLSYLPVREGTATLVRASVREQLSRRYRNLDLRIQTSGKVLEDLIPNSYRVTLNQDSSRFRGLPAKRIPLVKKRDALIFSNGLYYNNIAVWPSHGWYYESRQDRWKWQRPRLFSTVEDLLTRGFVLPYLLPMLENSGASVFLPVERDTQIRELIGDNDGSSQGVAYIVPENVLFASVPSGFLLKDTLYPGDNPFAAGSSLRFAAVPESDARVGVQAAFDPGHYGVYVSWQTAENSSSQVVYEVVHAAGTAAFIANQRIGGGTWVFLGTFRFDRNSPEVRPQGVYVSLAGESGTTISVDAVRFGGGMGNIARRPSGSVVANVWSLRDGSQPGEEISVEGQSRFTWKTSGRPRFMEGARYYLQYAGFPDTLVYNLNDGKNDYNDDYMSRGEWVNYLIGSPSGPQKDRNARGLGIPVDLAFSFHTDAGITPAERVIGTLAIYSTWPDEGLFPDGFSRMGSRDLSDMIQSQIVDDIRVLYNPDWSRRGLWDRQYSEAWRPNVPSMLLELLSHQNLADMRYGLDPRFRFSVSRSIYKGMLKYIASGEGRGYVVQPLPPDHFAIIRNGEDGLTLSWRPVTDPLEPSAKPSGYKIYQSIHDRGFVEIMSVPDTFAIITIREKSAVYRYKVTAYNDGGESFPTEVLSARLSGRKGTGLVVNGFDRVGGPAWFDNTIKAGIEWWNDGGVTDGRSFMYTGSQYNYNRAYPWMDDDNPGWGSSHADREGLPEYGNSFDYTALHGMDLFGSNGYSWVSVSDEAFCSPEFDLSPYFAVDIIMGEELSTPSGPAGSETSFQIYTPEFMQKVSEIASGGGNILLSGAYVGTDLTLSEDSAALKFARDVLRFTWRTNHAVNTGRFEATNYGKPWFTVSGSFNQEYHPEIYTVEAPDGILPSGDSAFTALRYSGNLVGAAVAFKGNYSSFVMGFPVESITVEADRRNLLREVIRFFEAKKETDEPFLSPVAIYDSHGAIIRGDKSEKKVYLLFSGDEYADGAEHVLNVLAGMKVKGYFFLTGRFLRNPEFREIIQRIIEDGHYLGPHSDEHLLYVPWENRDSLLISHDVFLKDLARNIEEIERLGVDPLSINLFLAPYEWYNRRISEWTREAGLTLINFTPGTGTNADYTTPGMSNYRSSDELMERLWQFEKNDPAGLNGAILLIHPGTHPERSDKFYHRLEDLIRELRGKGYKL
jgi:peptidoglycan/xylan/chitin deacetylase (PgdA/CDA1 family)